ncbi:MAG: hypothetical protein WAN09_00420 [Candidatus Korobacteraceae bacterium]
MTKPKDHAVCFAEALAEELVEVDALRRKKDKDLAPRESLQWSKVRNIAETAGASGGEDKDGVAAAEEARTVVSEARKMKLAGLAFSGGGIRSATFNLGVLQGLAQYNKVRTFDYLSTVSGGGYIGNWLEAWILRSGQEPKKRPTESARCKQDKEIEVKVTELEIQDAEVDVQIEEIDVQVAETDVQDEGIDVVEKELRPTRTARSKSVELGEKKDEKSHTEPPPIRFLREYSNYLTPRLGVLRADTWTIVAIYLRNLLLNQTVLTLLLFALLLLPYLAVCLTKALCVTWMWRWTAPMMVFALMTGALSVGARNLRGLIACEQKPERTSGWLPPQNQFAVIVTIVAPVFLAVWILTAWLSLHTGLRIGDWDTARNWYRWPCWGSALLGLPMAISWWFGFPPKKGHDNDARRELRKRNLVWSLWSLGTGAVSGLMMLAAVHEVFGRMQGWGGANWHELGLGVPLTLLVFLAAATIQVGLMGWTFVDPYREWWARVAGWILILTIMWAAVFGLAIYASLGLLWMRGWRTAGLAAWIASTATGVLGAKSAKTGALESAGVKVTLLSITPYVFIVGLVSLLSLSLELILARFYLPSMNEAWNTFLARSPGVEKAVNWVLKVSASMTSGAVTLSGTAATSPGPVPHATMTLVQAHFRLLDRVANPWLILVFFVVLGVCWLLSRRIDLNEFSMNLLYRNRLVRCYLGATHEERQANPFSGMDCCDDLFLKDLRSRECYSGPLPILNGTLNLVNSRDLAWQERKAESFPMTPFRCGFDTWIEQIDLERNYKRENKRRHISKYAYRPTENYGYKDKGFYVGTAMSISGAAACPNMGYHSVPSLAILLTFFNVRLGFWAGNPRNETWKNPGPRVGLKQLLCELFGWTDDNAKYVYLSDGGHFENLGVYELVKRRCKYIVACDAGEDPNYSFEDLGNAIRKCREDIGVEIELDTTRLVPKSSGPNVDRNKDNDKNDGVDKKLPSQHCVVGTIRYDMADPGGEMGVFVYIKASLTGDEPADVLNYHSAHKTFPHQSTANQWFTESQFESYRRLGQHIMETLFAGRKDTHEYQDLTSQDLMSREHLQAFRGLRTDELFEKLKKKWPPKDEFET